MSIVGLFFSIAEEKSISIFMAEVAKIVLLIFSLLQLMKSGRSINKNKQLSGILILAWLKFFVPVLNQRNI